MRQQAMENLLCLIDKEVDKARETGRVDLHALFNLSIKSKILRSRENDAAVLRELLSNG